MIFMLLRCDCYSLISCGLVQLLSELLPQNKNSAMHGGRFAKWTQSDDDWSSVKTDRKAKRVLPEATASEVHVTHLCQEAQAIFLGIAGAASAGGSAGANASPMELKPSSID